MTFWNSVRADAISSKVPCGRTGARPDGSPAGRVILLDPLKQSVYLVNLGQEFAVKRDTLDSEEISFGPRMVSAGR